MYGSGRAEKAPRKMLEQTDKRADTVMFWSSSRESGADESRKRAGERRGTVSWQHLSGIR
jgi:hypothetical protein